MCRRLEMTSVKENYRFESEVEDSEHIVPKSDEVLQRGAVDDYYYVDHGCSLTSEIVLPSGTRR